MNSIHLVKLVAATAATAVMTTGAIAQDIQIGANFPMSGPNAEYGDLFSTAAAIAVEHANADKMLSGILSMVVEDSQATPQQGVVSMNKLVNVEKVPYVLSAFTGVSKAIAPIGDKSKVVSINGGGISPDLAALGDYFWNVIPLVNNEVQALTPYLVKEQKFNKIALIFVDDPAGEAIKNELEKEIPRHGGKLVATFQIPRASQQFAGIAAKVRRAKPDAVFIASSGAPQAQIIKQLRDNGVKQQLVSYSSFSVPNVLQLPEAEGAIFPTQSIDWEADDITRRLAADWRKRKGKEPNAYVANYYNAVMVFVKLAQALEKDGQPITGENLLKQRQKSGTFEVAGGKMVFLSNGTVSVPLQLNQVSGGTSKVIKKKLVAQ